MSPHVRRRLLGGLVLLALPAGGAVALATPSVRQPALRVAEAVAGDLFPDPARERAFEVPSVEGIEPGTPAFVVEPDGSWRPAACAVRVGESTVTLRFSPGEDPAGAWILDARPPPDGFRESWDTAVSPEAAAELRADLVARLEAVFEEALVPEARRRLPAFWGRIDPSKDPRSREALGALGNAVLARIRPLADDLAGEVARSLDREFGFVDRVRLGATWLFRGAEKAKAELVPVARRAAEAWFETHSGEVFEAVSDAVVERGEDLKAWLGGEVLAAAEQELLRPVFEANRERLEKEGQAWLSAAAERVVLAPGGRFRLGFTAVLRRHLLDKESALLILERAP